MSTATEYPSAVAKARFVRVSPSKARRVIDLVRGKSVADALDILRWAPQAASEPVAKVIASAGRQRAEQQRPGPVDSGGGHRLRRRRPDRQADPSARPGPRIPDPSAHQPHHRRGGEPAVEGRAGLAVGERDPRPSRAGPSKAAAGNAPATKAPAKKAGRRQGAGQESIC